MSTDKIDSSKEGRRSSPRSGDFYGERRKHPRIVINRRSTIRETKENIVQHAIAHDISQGGLQIRCDHATAYTLYPSEDQINRERAPELDVRLSLPLREGLVELGARCRAVHRSVIPEDGVAFGLQFMTFTDDSAGNLIKFMEESVGRY
ncbi:MAG: PilZ domain-containing protein [Gammaproteobacteria bacterium]|nr:PilZ domain-containing protein [Gammaproteobacteria bacterium]MCI0590418.1 PilZ domain-containing protein [Gammaproteobacteria bacterium]